MSEKSKISANEVPSTSQATTSAESVDRPKSAGSLDRFCGASRQIPKVDRLLFSWLADATLPYNFVENVQFRLFVETINQLPHKYALPNEGKLRMSTAPRLFEALEWKVKQILKNEVQFYCFDTDLWTSPAHHSYLSFVIHFIDTSWCRK